MAKKRKTYPTTITGLLQAGWDRLVGNPTTYNDDTPTLTDLGGNPSMKRSTIGIDNNENFWLPEDRYEDHPSELYQHPVYGLWRRWEASMRNNTNPIKGLQRTVVPAAIGAAAVTTVPAKGIELLGKAKNTVPTIFQAAKAHPKLVSDIAKTAGRHFGISLGQGVVGGKIADATTQILSDKNFDQWAAPKLGISEGLASWFNPGYLLGGYNGINRSIDQYLSAKKSIPYLQNKLTELNQLFKKDQIKKENYDELYHSLRIKQMLIALPRIQSLSKSTFDRLRSNFNWYKTFIRENPNVFPKNFVTVVGHDVPYTTTFEGSPSANITFNGHTSTVYPSFQSLEQQGIGTVRGKLQMQGRPTFTAVDAQQSSLVPIVQGNTSEIQKGLQSYIENLQNIMKHDGAVAGSVVQYRNGIIKGTETPHGYIGPADTEIYTTQARLPSLLKSLQFKSNSTNSVGGQKGISPFTFRSNVHPGVDTEINIIEADANGNATGKVAHQIYRALHPTEYSQMMYDHVMSGGKTPTSKLSLPISAEDLFAAVRDNPEAMQHHLLTDLVGMETFTRPENLKAKKRLFSVLFDPNQTERLDKALTTVGQINLGSRFKRGTDLYPNLTFSDINANKEFLQKVFQLSDIDAAQAAANPQIMKNAFNLYNRSYSTGVRLVGNDVVSEKAANGELLRNPKLEMFTGNGSISGGSASGPGLNRALLNPEGGWNVGTGTSSRNTISMSQLPITYYPEKIKTPLDLLSQIQKLQNDNTNSQLFGELANLGNQSKATPYKYDMQLIEKLRQLSRQNDTPFTLNPGLYGLSYQGGLAEPIAVGARFGTVGDTPELGSLLKDLSQMKVSSKGVVGDATTAELEQEINKVLPEIERSFSRYPLRTEYSSAHSPYQLSVVFAPPQKPVKSEIFHNSTPAQALKGRLKLKADRQKVYDYYAKRKRLKNILKSIDQKSSQLMTLDKYYREHNKLGDKLWDARRKRLDVENLIFSASVPASLIGLPLMGKNMSNQSYRRWREQQVERELEREKKLKTDEK